jgi:hypothetical protein
VCHVTKKTMIDTADICDLHSSSSVIKTGSQESYGEQEVIRIGRKEIRTEF